MAILSRKFSSSLWCLKEYRKEVQQLDISESTRESILTAIDYSINKLVELQSRFKYMRSLKK